MLYEVITMQLIREWVFYRASVFLNQVRDYSRPRQKYSETDVPLCGVRTNTVITSYSIHYTKLYEFLVPGTTSGGERRGAVPGRPGHARRRDDCQSTVQPYLRGPPSDLSFSGRSCAGQQACRQTWRRHGLHAQLVPARAADDRCPELV